MKTLQILFAAAFAMSTASAIERPVPPSVLVESVQFRQSYPWNGLVDIDAKITCSDPATNLAVYVAAWDNVKDRALTVKTIWVEGDETKNSDIVAKSGTTRFVWGWAGKRKTSRNGECFRYRWNGCCPGRISHKPG